MCNEEVEGRVGGDWTGLTRRWLAPPFWQRAGRVPNRAQRREVAEPQQRARSTEAAEVIQTTQTDVKRNEWTVPESGAQNASIVSQAREGRLGAEV